jgi:ADP-heptose:LPS heptosyltransferase
MAATSPSPRPTPRPLAHPGRGIAIIAERESLGDGFYKLHLLRALRRLYPGEKITWIVSESDSPYRNVMAAIVAPLVDRVVAPAHLRGPLLVSGKNLRALPRFGLVIDHRSHSGVIAATKLLLGADVYQAATPGYLFCTYRPHGPRPPHKLDRLMTLLAAAAGCAVDGSGEIDLPPAITEEARRLLPDGPRYVGIAPGASSNERYWPMERQIALADWISGQGWQPVVLMGPYEKPLYPSLRAAMPQALFPGWSETEVLSDIGLFLALTHRLAAAVSNDTGTGHLMAATGIPLLSLFGPTDPRTWRPVTANGRVIWSRDYGGPQMQRIPYEDVRQVVAEMMA